MREVTKSFILQLWLFFFSYKVPFFLVVSAFFDKYALLLMKNVNTTIVYTQNSEKGRKCPLIYQKVPFYLSKVPFFIIPTLSFWKNVNTRLNSSKNFAWINPGYTLKLWQHEIMLLAWDDASLMHASEFR